MKFAFLIDKTSSAFYFPRVMISLLIRLLAFASISSFVNAACTLSNPEQLDPDLTLQHCYDCDNDEFSIRLVYSGPTLDRWLGIGVNRDGDSMMVPVNSSDWETKYLCTKVRFGE